MAATRGDAGRRGTRSWSVVSSSRRLPTAGVLTAVDAQDFAGHEGRMLEIEDRLGDITGLAHAADRVELGERLVGRLGDPRRPDDGVGDPRCGRPAPPP